MEILDASTGALSWEAFATFATATLAQAIRRQGPISLLLVGVDPLPPMTTGSGLSLDNTAMLVLASALLRVVRGGDIVGRCGEMAFAVLAHDASPAGAARLAERLHAAVPNSLSSPRGQVPFTVSIGIAAVPEAGTTLPELMQYAEQALRAAVQQGGRGVYLSATTARAPETGSTLEAERREDLTALMRAYERHEIQGIVIRTHPGACSVCLDAGRDICKPHLTPIPSLPLLGCLSPNGCRCLYISPEQDPRRHPPLVPAQALGKFDVPRRLRDAAHFGEDPKKSCKPEEMGEYLDSLPLLPIESRLRLHEREAAYLQRPAVRAGAGHGPVFPFEGSLRAWAKQPGKPLSVSKDSLWHQQEGSFSLTNWRVLFGSDVAADAILLADIVGIEYLSAGLSIQTAGESRRSVFLLRDPLLCGLYVTKAVRDLARLSR
jgi:diguanylate cyclase (GGDEF)-like protein